MIERVRTAFENERLCNEFLPNPNGEWSWEHSVNTWGTKWEVEGELDTIEDGVILTFDSAWSPPIGLYEKLYSLGYEVLARYYEPAMAFAGTYEDGSDDCYDYSGMMNSEEIAKYLPEELDQYFGISENVAQWEDENSEELDEETVDGNED
jgi:hypothetical protein